MAAWDFGKVLGGERTITHAEASTNSVAGAHNEVRQLNDGPAIGQRVRYWKPGTDSGFWGYDISPADQYTG